MKILIVGDKGWIGTIFKNHIRSLGMEIGTNNGDINHINNLPEADVLVNFAASTNIDWCEKNKYEAFKNNVLGAINLAELCKKANIKYVFISSACIFESKDVNDIKFEDSKPSPGCFYTETKVMAEKLIREINPGALIVRPRLPISEVAHPRNTLNKLIGYSKLINCQESLTIVEDFVVALLEMIRRNDKGTINVVNEGTISPSEIGRLMGHTFEEYTKQDLDLQIKNEGKAGRVSTIVGSHYGYLPPIRDRIHDVINKWKKTTI